ncbi:MAG: VCBS repeat-containing protein [Pseudomonadota bacterium]
MICSSRAALLLVVLLAGCGSETTIRATFSGEDAAQFGPGNQWGKVDGGGPDGIGPTDGIAAELFDAGPGDGGTAGDVLDDQGGDVTPDTPPLPDVTDITVEDDVSCLFVPEVGAFAPVLECFWDDPVQKTQHDDVVMTPVVANLTDDNHDGLVDTHDIPDIAFLTYRRAEDGCCNVDAVLRVVTGSCQGGITGQGSGDKLLHEHYWIASPALDNSSGLAVGDVDGDGRPDLVGIRNGGGTVAFSSVLSHPIWPEAVTAHNGWTVVGTADPVEAVAEEIPDDGKLLTASQPGEEIRFTGTWPLSTRAIAMVYIEVWARPVGPAVDLTGVLVSGGESTQSVPVKAQASGDWERLIFEFPKNPFTGDHQWTDADLEGLEFGIIHGGPIGAAVEVTRVDLVVDYVVEKWQSAHPKGVDFLAGPQPIIADLEKDGAAEVIVGRVVLAGADGALKWKGSAGIGTNSFLGPISLAADIDLDGQLEVVAGDTAYRANGDVYWTYAYGEPGSGCNAYGFACDGFGATGNFDADPEAEVAIIRRGVLYILQHDGTLMARVVLPGIDCQYNEGGPPTVADFDGDGRPEVAAAGADYYVVFDLDCCADLPLCSALPPDAEGCDSPGIRWKVANQDCSSRVTGSSVFDFDGDGQAEVIYNDETLFRIFRGADGKVLFEQPNTSHTRLEYPLVADTDSDGNAEIVIIENGNDKAPVPLQIWGDAHNHWVPTRRIWNQHAYNITSVTEGGLLPPGGETPNWEVFNNFRQNLPDYDPYLAPDLIASVTGQVLTGCPGVLGIKAKVCNVGQLWVPPWVGVTFYSGLTMAPLPCADPAGTPVTLEPGQCVGVTCDWLPTAPVADATPVRVCVDGGSYQCTGPGVFNECDELNNAGDGAVGPCL